MTNFRDVEIQPSVLIHIHGRVYSRVCVFDVFRCFNCVVYEVGLQN